MSVQMEIGKPIDNNRVEVRATYNGASRRDFSVQQDKSDEFVSSYKKMYNKASLLSTLGMCILGGLGGVAGGQLAKNSNNSWVRWGAVIAGGLAGYITSMFAFSPMVINAHKNLLNKFGAEELPAQKAE